MKELKDFVSYDESYQLKKFGYNKPCLKYTAISLADMHNGDYCFVEKKLGLPLYSEAFRWFREKYNLPSTIMYRVNMDDGGICYDWLILGQDTRYRHFDTYEDAEIACLRMLLEIVKIKYYDKQQS
jgi:hypothetical protein